MTRRLVWTSDPEEARRLREEGKLDAPVDVEPFFLHATDGSGLTVANLAEPGKDWLA